MDMETQIGELRSQIVELKSLAQQSYDMIVQVSKEQYVMRGELNQMNERIGSLENRMGSLENRMGQQENRTSDIQAQLSSEIRGIQAQLGAEIRSNFKWMIGLSIPTWLALIALIAKIFLGS